MQTITPGSLRPGDVVRFIPNGNEYAVIEGAQLHPFEHSLRVVEFSVLGSLTMSADTPLYPVRTFRTADVPCLVCKAVFVIRVNTATHRPPTGVLCKACDDESTAEVMSWRRDKSAKED